MTITQAEQEKKTVALSSVAAAVFLTVVKLIAGYATGSLGIISEAVHSALDLVAAFVTYFAVRVSDRPPDQEHLYGHGKVESLSALIETALLFVTCLWIIYEALQRLLVYEVPVEANVWGFGVMVLSIAINVSRSQALSRVARKYGSQALEADALHFSSDVLSSLVVIVGLAFVHFGWTRADPLAALGVAAIVIVATWQLGRRTVDVLLDRAPEGLADHLAVQVEQIPGVEKCDRLRVRRSGAQAFVDMNISVGRTIPFETAHAVALAVERKVHEFLPNVDVVVHTDPAETQEESIIARLRSIAGKRQLYVHNVSVHESRRKLHVDLHLEVDQHLNLRQAHQIASLLEEDIKRDIPSIVELNTHIESRDTGVVEGEDVTARMPAVVREIRAIALEVPGLRDCHAVILRKVNGNLAVSMHCTLDEELSMAQVHQVSTEVERRLMNKMPDVERVIVHTEPLRQEVR